MKQIHTAAEIRATATTQHITANEKVITAVQAMEAMGTALAQVGREYAATGKPMPGHGTFVKLAKLHSTPTAADIFERFFSSGYAAIN